MGEPPFIIISERKLCATLREYRRLPAPRDAAACRQLPRRAAAGMSLTIASGLRTLTAAFRTARRI